MTRSTVFQRLFHPARAGALAAVVLLTGAVEPRAKSAAEPRAPAVTRMVQEKQGGLDRITLHLTREPRFSLFTLVEPYRIVFDFEALDWAAGPPDAPALPVVALRHGLFRPDRARIVVELDGPMEVAQVFTALEGGASPFRLTLGLRDQTPEAFAATAGWPEGARWTPEPQAAPIPGRIVVAIDPGHGGIDPGASVEGLVEKDIVLAFAHRLAARIDAMPGFQAALTRRDDRFVPLRGRVRMAHAAGAHLMLSLHTDTLESGEAEGASLYTLSREGTDDAADAFAERENRADILAGADLSGAEDDVTRLLIALARRGTEAESVKLAETLVDALRGTTRLLDTRPHRRGNFFVLKAPDLPSVLIELGFLSSPADRARLADPDWNARMADALAQGVADWAKLASPGFLAPRD